MKKIVISIILFSLLVSASYASDFVGIYEDLKVEYPDFVDRMIDGGASESDIEMFLSELGTVVQSYDDLTVDNFDTKMYQGLKEILFEDGKVGVAKEKYWDFTMTLLSEFNDEITKTIKDKKLSGDLESISEAIKDVIFEQTTSSKPIGFIPPVEIRDWKTISQKNDEFGNLYNEILIDGELFLEMVQDDSLNISLDVCSDVNLDNEKIVITGLGKILNKYDLVELKSNLAKIEFDSYFTSGDELTMNIEKTDDESFNITMAGSLEDLDIKLDKPLKVSLAFEPEGNVGFDNLVVLCFDEQGNEILLGGKYNNGYYEFLTNSFSSFKIADNFKTFEDLNQAQWARLKIESLASKGYINGYPGGLFHTESNITRAEVAALITRMMRIEGNVANLKFKDLSLKDWFLDDVAAVFDNGIMVGISIDEFNPNGNITQQEVMVLLSRILKEKGYQDVVYEMLNVPYDDMQIADWAKCEIGIAIKNKLYKDMPLGRFVPNKLATRSEVANMLYEFYKK